MKNATMEHKLTETRTGHAFVGKQDSVLVNTDGGSVTLGVNTFNFPGAAYSWNYSHMSPAEARQVAALLNAAADRAQA